jgi:hypothetical protein
VVAVAQTDTAALGSSSPPADNFSVAAIRNSAAAVIDNCAAQNNYVPARTDIEAELEAGWTLVVGVVLDAAVVTGWVPGAKSAEENRCDDSAQGTAPPPMPAS